MKPPMFSLWRDLRLKQLLGSKHPIIQAPMAGATSVEMVIEAIRAGAVGSLPCALLTPDQARVQIATVRAAAEGPLNLNFFAHDMGTPPSDAAWRKRLEKEFARYGSGPSPAMRLPFGEEMCELVEDSRPEIVSFHFGLPPEGLLQRVKAAGSVILSSATTVAEARWLAERGCDAIIAQGWEAGGHRGWFLDFEISAQLGLFALLPQVADAVDVPVIAAGGIGDGRGIAAAFILGAGAVQLGTAFLKTAEAPISDAHRRWLQDGDASVTVLTNVLSGGMARGYPTAFVRDYGPASPEAPPFPYAGKAVGELKNAAGDDGLRFATMWAGQAAALAPPMTTEKLIGRLAEEALMLLEGKNNG